VTGRKHMPMPHLLVVEDEVKVAHALRCGLGAAGYDVVLCLDGQRGWLRAQQDVFDAAVLDLMLPGRGGLEVLTALRVRSPATAVLVLTARDAIEDRVTGLDAGADDYLVKPFALAELLARLRALLRRGRHEPARLAVADLEMDPATRTVARAGSTIELTAREYEVLEYLVRNRGHLVSREMLTRDVWRETARATSLDNVIDVHIARLRKKVDHEHAQKLIQTVRGVGFLLRERPE
jgi:DNA-binding response OmpR family regulator